MADQNIETLQKKTYLKAIENSVGSKLFNSLFVRFKDSGKIVDILSDGEFSCAFFVSNILFMFQAIDKPHTTVKTLAEIFSKNPNWQKIEFNDAETGDVIFYEKIKFENESEHAHVGFVLNKNEAVSTSYKTKTIVKHPINNGKIETIYRFSWPSISEVK